MRRPQYRAIPIRHQQVVAVLQAVRTRLGAEAFFAFFELFEEAEVARDFGGHGCGVELGVCDRFEDLGRGVAECL